MSKLAGGQGNFLMRLRDLVSSMWYNNGSTQYSASNPGKSAYQDWPRLTSQLAALPGRTSRMTWRRTSLGCTRDCGHIPCGCSWSRWCENQGSAVEDVTRGPYPVRGLDMRPPAASNTVGCMCQDGRFMPRPVMIIPLFIEREHADRRPTARADSLRFTDSRTRHGPGKATQTRDGYGTQ